MPRLRSIKPAVGELRPVLGRTTDKHGHDIEAEPWRRWYWLKRWRDLRLRVLIRDLYTCQICHKVNPDNDTRRLIADHKIPHKGDPDLFWDEDNVQTLCASCHSGTKQRMEKRGIPAP